MTYAADSPHITVVHTADLDDRTLTGAHSLLYDVFDDMTEFDWEHCLGGLHVLAFAGDELIGHAAVVQRRIGYRGRPLRAGYVEGVAVRAAHRGRGCGSAVMAPVERIIRRAYDLGALGSTDEATHFYARRGWQRWIGRSYGITPEGLIRTEEDDGFLYVLPVTVPLELSADLTADWRIDSAW